MFRTLNGRIRSKNTRYWKYICITSLQKQRNLTRLVWRGVKATWIPGSQGFHHTDAKPALEAWDSSGTHKNCPNPISFLVDCNSLRRFVFYCGPLFKHWLLLSIICRMPKEIFQENPKPNPLYFITATATAVEICRWSTWLQTVMDFYPVLGGGGAKEEVQIR